jgi:protein TonB
MPLDFAFEQTMIDHPEKDKSIKSDVQFVPPDQKSSAPTGTATAPSGTASSSSGPAVPQTVRVSQGVSEGLLIRAVRPVYPNNARMNRVQGKVLLRAVIGKDGRVEKLEVVSGPKELTQAAVDAVQQWRYRPYYLAGSPVEVDTQITVNFELR